MISKAIVEIPKFSKYKWEIKNGIAVVDRVLSIHCPQNYGYIPDTLAEDGDALDVFICSAEPLPIGLEVEIEIIGEYICIDNGVIDNKLVAFLKDEGAYKLHLASIEAYLKRYKDGFKMVKFKPSFDINDLNKYLK